MIYVSSSCVKHKKIKDSILELIDYGFKNIELSGGTEYYDGFEDDLLVLKKKYDLNYICHNYFPPPKEHFVLNLASLDNEIYVKTLDHLKQTIVLSQKLGATKFGFHAGFFIDIKVSEIGQKITKENLYDKQEAIKRFCDGFLVLQKLADSLELYIENNVFSSTNYKTYNGENFFMLTCSDEYERLKECIDFSLLLDVAHLKVSSRSLNLNFEEEWSYLIKSTDYIHISDNDSLHDINSSIKEKSDLVDLLRKEDLKNKDFTLEIYDGLDELKNSYKLLQGLVS